MDLADAQRELAAKMPNPLPPGSPYGAARLNARDVKPEPGEPLVKLTVPASAGGAQGGIATWLRLDGEIHQPVLYPVGEYLTPARLAPPSVHEMFWRQGAKVELVGKSLTLASPPASPDRFCSKCGRPTGRPHARQCEHFVSAAAVKRPARGQGGRFAKTARGVVGEQAGPDGA